MEALLNLEMNGWIQEVSKNDYINNIFERKEIKKFEKNNKIANVAYKLVFSNGIRFLISELLLLIFVPD